MDIRAKLSALRSVRNDLSSRELCTALAVAAHETRCGDAWEGEYNWGAVQERALTAAEKARLAAAGIAPGKGQLAEAMALLGLRGLHEDSSPTRGAYFVKFFAFDSDAEGAAHFAKVLYDDRPTVRAAVPRGLRAVASAMRVTHYYEGFSTDLDRVVDDYHRALAPWYLEISATPRVGEAIGSVAARIVRNLDGEGPGRTLEALARPVEGDDAPREIWRTTNCATSARWILARIGCTHPRVTAPDRVARAADPAGPVSWLVSAARDCGALIDCRGWSREHLERVLGEGWLIHYATPGASNDHIEWCLDRDVADVEPDEHGGGGRGGNLVTTGTGDLTSSLGRPAAHIVDIERLVPFTIIQGPAEPIGPTVRWQ